MSRHSLRSLCIFCALLAFTFSGCRTGKKDQATIDPSPTPDPYVEKSSPWLPPLPSFGRSRRSRPQLLPERRDLPLEAPPNIRSTSPTSRSPLSGPSLPLPAPPAEEF